MRHHLLLTTLLLAIPFGCSADVDPDRELAYDSEDDAPASTTDDADTGDLVPDLELDADLQPLFTGTVPCSSPDSARCARGGSKGSGDVHGPSCVLPFGIVCAAGSCGSISGPGAPRGSYQQIFCEASANSDGEYDPDIICGLGTWSGTSCLGGMVMTGDPLACSNYSQTSCEPCGGPCEE